jgi:hypothetical protein
LFATYSDGTLSNCCERHFERRPGSTKAIETLAGIMSNPKAPAAARISAACALLDRGYGKPLQGIEATNTNVTCIVSDKPMTEEEWIAEHVTEN